MTRFPILFYCYTPVLRSSLLMVAFFFLFGISRGFSQQTTTADSAAFVPIADGFVRSGMFAGINYGADSVLHVKGTPLANESRRVYLKFALSNVGDVVSARLRIFGRNAENMQTVAVAVMGVDNDTWTETGLNWNTAPPALADSLGRINVGGEGRYYEVDVSAFVRDRLGKDRVVSFLLQDTVQQNAALSFHSREHLFFKPELRVTVSNPVVPGNARLFVENLDRFPSHEDFIASRIQIPWSRDKKTYNTNHDTLRVRLHNKGLDSLVIRHILLSNNSHWKIIAGGGTATDTVTLPLTIGPDSFSDLQLAFTAYDSGSFRVKLLTDELSIVSNDGRTPFKTVYLRGLLQREGEGSKEPTAQEMLAAFGFKTTTGFGATDPDKGAGNKPKGDDVLTSYFVRADTLQPVTVRQMGAYHGCCTVQPDTISWYQKGNPAVLFKITPHNAEDAQRLLPRRSRSATYMPAEGSFTPDGPFGLKVGANDWSDTLLTPGQKIGLRVWKAVDKHGRVIPNTYIISNDYLGTSATNFDYNDNMYFVSNIRPELGPAAASALASLPSAVDFGEQLSETRDSFRLTLYNAGGEYSNGAKDPPVVISAVVITGENRQEFDALPPAKTILPVQDSTSMLVTFTPQTQGLKAADLLIYFNNAASPLRVPLYAIARNSQQTVSSLYRINSGAAAEVTLNGKTWQPDTAFAFDNLQALSTERLPIKATDEDLLYQSKRSSDSDRRSFRYELPVENGSYWVRLHFAETYWGMPGAGVSGGAGSRVMSIKVEDELKLINLDVTQEVGSASAIVKNIPVTVADGKLNISFLASANRPMVCAVELYQFKTSTVTSTGSIPVLPVPAKPDVYPNPFTQKVTIRFPATYRGTVNLQLVDIAGRVYDLGKAQVKPGGYLLEKDLSRLALARGLYFLRLSSAGNGVDAIRILVQ